MNNAVQTVSATGRAGPRFGRLPCILSLLAVTVCAFAQSGARESALHANPSSYPWSLSALGDTLFFVADDGIHGRELWVCDVNGDCRLADDIVPGPAGSDPRDLSVIDDRLFFYALIPDIGREPFAWDAEAGEARLLGDLNPGSGHGDPTFIGVGNEQLYMFATSADFGREPYLCDLNALEPRIICDTEPGPSQTIGGRGAVGPDGALYFFSINGLIRSDGTADGTGLLLTTEERSDLPHTGCILPWRGGILFTFQNPELGRELWWSDGSAGGSRVVRDIAPGTASSGIAEIIQCGDLAYFAANDGVHGLEPWVSDGTPNGTRMIGDVQPGLNSSNPYGFTLSGERVYFLADDGQHGKELWCLDGARQTPRMVADLYPGLPSSAPWRLVPYGDALLFCADSPEYGEEIYITRGDRESTRVFIDVAPGPKNSGPHQLTVIGDTVFFSCVDGMHGEEVWRTDGTPSGTRLVADIARPRFNPGSRPGWLTTHGENLYFVVEDGSHGEELWFSDGTETGTTMVQDLYKGKKGSVPRLLTSVGPYLYFTAVTADAGRELWRVRGPGEKAALVCDAWPGARGADPEDLVGIRGALLFTIAQERGRRLWWAGNESNEPGPVADSPDDIVDLFQVGGVAYLYADPTNETAGLWTVEWEDGVPQCRYLDEVTAAMRPGDTRLDPTARLAVSVHPLATAGGGGAMAGTAALGPAGPMLFPAYDDEAGGELWAAGPEPGQVRRIRDAFPGRASSSPSNLYSFRDLVYFVADHPTYGRTLWCTDGTEAGTVVVEPRQDSTYRVILNPIEFETIGDILVFSGPSADANRPRTDIELGFLIYRSERQWFWPHEDEDIRPGPESSRPHDLTRAGANVYFVADDGMHGAELWRTDGTSGGTRMVKDILVPGDLRSLSRTDPEG